MCAYGQIVILNNHIAHGAGRHVQPERLPVITVIEGNINGALGCGEQQPAALGVFTDGVHIFVAGNAIDDLRPGLAGVARAQDVRTQVVKAQRVDGGVCGLRVKVAGVDDGNFLERRHVGRRDLTPVRAAIDGEVHASVVRARP